MTVTADRRALLTGAAALAAGSVFGFRPGPALAQSGDLPAIQAAVAAGKDASTARIQDWIRNPSIAAENLNMPEGAEYMARLARDAGFSDVEIIPTDGHPGVFGVMDVGAPRWLAVYFMYDVKQFDPAEWSSPPLEAALVDKEGFGRVIVGRGAVNQKGPEGAFLAALHALRAAGKSPPVNLVLVCEGEEEIGSPHFRQVTTRPNVLAALKKCEGVFIPTGWQSPSTGAVTINLGAKGIIECELTASGAAWGRGPARDIHSSQKANVDSPAWRLVAALSSLVSPDGNTPAIEGWFEHVRDLTPRERELIAASAEANSEADAKRALGVQTWIDDLPWRQSLERLASQPTVNIEGLVAGYTGPGGKTVLPGSGTAKLDMRLVPNQTVDDCLAKLRAHLDAKGFPDVEVRFTGGYNPTATAEDSRIIRAQKAVYDRAGAPSTLYPRSAGSWPGCVFTDAPVGLPAGQFGLGHGSGAHAPNEYFVIDSTNPKVAGLDGATLGFVDFLYEMASIS
ncbi:M20/M25/M40 family metallo-hydrolase [Brevundimonas lenta]|uniref:Acetylornithine deacetylase/succinyl-diaminopimelate desuccinylase-like protein n=1 Tax=Brevundimonas lenta TaxID=424796 RepID=A0A7W6JHK6_9CAUL|nr:M20/M25/M40 family metallo-hydrolase [Brevundimonas lenta]MBB4084252.1 acetylornithine deacetylase/succinyl-diaminopimelate desuccinylase-like protein [Brevundimonas lenta]